MAEEAFEEYPCSWLMEVPRDEPDGPWDRYYYVECGATVRLVKESVHGQHTRCDTGHVHDPYGSPESEASLWELEHRWRQEGY